MGKHDNNNDSGNELALNNSDLSQISNPLIEKIIALVENTRNKVAETFDQQNIATLSQQLSRRHLTELPSKEWFADKLHRAIVIAKSAQS